MAGWMPPAALKGRRDLAGQLCRDCGNIITGMALPQCLLLSCATVADATCENFEVQP